MNHERRTNLRIPLKLPARYDGLSGGYEARIEDISLGGCFVNARGQVQEGDGITVEIKLPSGEWLRLPGKVTACYPGIGFGVEFTNLTLAQELSLEQLVNSSL